MSKVFDSLDDSLKKAEISMAPLIDMVFILLIFFVVTTTFTKETGIVVEKAKASTAESINTNLLTVAIDIDGNYWHNEQQRTVDELILTVITAFEENSETNVVLIPDCNGTVEHLVTIMDRLRAEEITRFSLGTERVSAE